MIRTSILPALFFILVLSGSSCRKDPPVIPGSLTALCGDYNGKDYRYFFSMATGSHTDSTTITYHVHIDYSALNRIVIDNDTFVVDSLNAFQTIHPSSDFHVFNYGSFSTNANGTRSLYWSRGYAFLGQSSYTVFRGEQ